jgi:transcriptional regulator with XRE-family HTH domain
MENQAGGIKALFGSRLKTYRKKANLSQEELAEKTGVTVKHLSSLERGKCFVSARLLEQLAEVLRIPPAAFFCKDNEQVVNRAFLLLMQQEMMNKLSESSKTIAEDMMQTAAYSPGAPAKSPSSMCLGSPSSPSSRMR